MNEQSLKFRHIDEIDYPSSITYVESVAGRNISANADLSLFRSYDFESQQFGFGCGICSATIVMNSMKGTKLSQTAVYNNHIRDKIIRHSDRYYGMTLDNVASLVQSLGASSVKTNYAFTPSSIYTTLKSDLKFLSSTQKNYGIITNYYRRASDHNGGHISPIVSYNEIEDSVLIMDTNPSRFPSHWVKLADLCTMMSKVDRGSEKPRGYLMITK